jgi:hypothetical protein
MKSLLVLLVLLLVFWFGLLWTMLGSTRRDEDDDGE